MVSEVKALTPRQMAEAEVAEEQRRNNVKLFKDKMIALEKAKKVVRAIENELDDLEAELSGD